MTQHGQIVRKIDYQATSVAEPIEFEMNFTEDYEERKALERMERDKKAG